MVRGISKQVIVVQSPDEKMFEQAIFIINDSAVGRAGITDEALMHEAKKLINAPVHRKRKNRLYGPVWACGGALIMAVAWVLTALLQ